MCRFVSLSATERSSVVGRGSRTNIVTRFTSLSSIDVIRSQPYTCVSLCTTVLEGA